MDADAYSTGQCKHGNFYDSCGQCEDEFEIKNSRRNDMTTPEKFELDFEKLREDIDLVQLNDDLIGYRDQIARLREAVERLQYEADAIPAIKAERDEWKARCEFSFEQRDKLTAERDALKTSNDSYITLANTAYELTEQRTAERDALKDAARLALDALNTCETEGEQVRYSTYDTESVGSAIAALKEVL